MKDDKKSISIQHVSMLCRSNFSLSRALHLAPHTMNPHFLTCLFPGYSSPLLQLELANLWVWLRSFMALLYERLCPDSFFTWGWFSTIGEHKANSLSENLSLTSLFLLLCSQCLNSSIFLLHPGHLPISDTLQSILQAVSHKQDGVMRNLSRKKEPKWEI